MKNFYHKPHEPTRTIRISYYKFVVFVWFVVESFKNMVKMNENF